MQRQRCHPPAPQSYYSHSESWPGFMDNALTMARPAANKRGDRGDWQFSAFEWVHTGYGGILPRKAMPTGHLWAAVTSPKASQSFFCGTARENRSPPAAPREGGGGKSKKDNHLLDRHMYGRWGWGLQEIFPVSYKGEGTTHSKGKTNHVVGFVLYQEDKKNKKKWPLGHVAQLKKTD